MHDFWSRVDQPEVGCWTWQGPTHWRDGYGHIKIKGQQKRAHRVAWELTFGPIPVGLLVLHHCDNPPCCRPLHLFLGTVSDNQRDSVAKGRHYLQRDPQAGARLSAIGRAAQAANRKEVIARG